MDKQKTICLDFDGVVHSYKSGWQGAANIPDKPVPGAFQFIERCLGRGYDVAIFSSRSNEKGAIKSMQSWMLKHGCPAEIMAKVHFPLGHKPPAHIYIDDRGHCFDGMWPSMDYIDGFKPWHKVPYRDEPPTKAALLARLKSTEDYVWTVALDKQCGLPIDDARDEDCEGCPYSERLWKDDESIPWGVKHCQIRKALGIRVWEDEED
jgi:hypothetical protein